MVYRSELDQTEWATVVSVARDFTAYMRRADGTCLVRRQPQWESTRRSFVKGGSIEVSEEKMLRGR